MATFGGLGGLGGFDPGDILGAIGQSLLMSPRNAPLAGLPMAIANQNKAAEKRGETSAMVLALTKAGFDPATAAVLARNPQAAALSISTDNAAKSRGLAEKAMGEVDSLLPPASGAAPAAVPAGVPGVPRRVGGMLGIGGMDVAAAGPQGGTGVPGSALDLIMQHESAGKNVPQGIVPEGGGYNPSVGRVTGPSSASGYFQMIDPTWRSAAKMAGIDTSQYPTAISAPYELQRKAAAALYEREGFKPWAPYNASLRTAIAKAGGSRAFTNDGSSIAAIEDARVPSTGPGVELAYGARQPVQVADASGRTGAPLSANEPVKAQPSAPGGLDAGSFMRIQLAARSNPNTPVNQLLGPATLQANPSLFTGPDGSPLTASAALAKLTSQGTQVATAGTTPAPMPGEPTITTAQVDGLPRDQVAANGGKIPVPAGDLKMPMEKPNVADNTKTMQAWAFENYKRGLKLRVAASAMGDAGKPYLEIGKAAMDMSSEYMKPTEIERVISAAGIDPRSPQGRSLLLASADKRSDVVKNAEIAYPGQPNRVREAVRNSLPDSRPEIVRTGQAAQDTPGLVNSGLEVEARRKQADAAATTTGTKTAEAAMGAPAALDRANAALATIDKLRKHPSREIATGFTGIFPRIPGTGQADFLDLLGQAKGTAFLQAFESLKGGGAITEVEGAKATQAIARLSETQSEEGFLQALNDLEGVIRGGMARAQRAAGGAPPGGSSPGSMTTPYGTIRQIR